MAEKLQEFTFPHCHGYRYRKFLDGSIWKLISGEDFHCQIKSLVSSVHNEAKRQGLKIRTTIVGEDLVIQAYKQDDEAL